MTTIVSSPRSVFFIDYDEEFPSMEFLLPEPPLHPPVTGSEDKSSENAKDPKEVLSVVGTDKPNTKAQPRGKGDAGGSAGSTALTRTNGPGGNNQSINTSSSISSPGRGLKNSISDSSQSQSGTPSSNLTGSTKRSSHKTSKAINRNRFQKPPRPSKAGLSTVDEEAKSFQQVDQKSEVSVDPFTLMANSVVGPEYKRRSYIAVDPTADGDLLEDLSDNGVEDFIVVSPKINPEKNMMMFFQDVKQKSKEIVAKKHAGTGRWSRRRNREHCPQGPQSKPALSKPKVANETDHMHDVSRRATISPPPAFAKDCHESKKIATLGKDTANKPLPPTAFRLLPNFAPYKLYQHVKRDDPEFTIPGLSDEITHERKGIFASIMSASIPRMLGPRSKVGVYDLRKFLLDQTRFPSPIVGWAYLGSAGLPVTKKENLYPTVPPFKKEKLKRHKQYKQKDFLKQMEANHRLSHRPLWEKYFKLHITCLRYQLAVVKAGRADLIDAWFAAGGVDTLCLVQVFPLPVDDLVNLRAFAKGSHDALNPIFPDVLIKMRQLRSRGEKKIADPEKATQMQMATLQKQRKYLQTKMRANLVNPPDAKTATTPNAKEKILIHNIISNQVPQNLRNEIMTHLWLRRFLSESIVHFEWNALWKTGNLKKETNSERNEAMSDESILENKDNIPIVCTGKDTRALSTVNLNEQAIKEDYTVWELFGNPEKLNLVTAVTVFKFFKKKEQMRYMIEKVRALNLHHELPRPTSTSRNCPHTFTKHSISDSFEDIMDRNLIANPIFFHTALNATKPDTTWHSVEKGMQTSAELGFYRYRESLRKGPFTFPRKATLTSNLERDLQIQFNKLQSAGKKLLEGAEEVGILIINADLNYEEMYQAINQRMLLVKEIESIVKDPLLSECQIEVLKLLNRFNGALVHQEHYLSLKLQYDIDWKLMEENDIPLEKYHNLQYADRKLALGEEREMKQLLLYLQKETENTRFSKSSSRSNSLQRSKSEMDEVEQIEEEETEEEAEEEETEEEEEEVEEEEEPEEEEEIDSSEGSDDMDEIPLSVTLLSGTPRTLSSAPSPNSPRSEISISISQKSSSPSERETQEDRIEQKTKRLLELSIKRLHNENLNKFYAFNAIHNLSPNAGIDEIFNIVSVTEHLLRISKTPTLLRFQEKIKESAFLLREKHTFSDLMQKVRSAAPHGLEDCLEEFMRQADEANKEEAAWFTGSVLEEAFDTHQFALMGQTILNIQEALEQDEESAPQDVKMPSKVRKTKSKNVSSPKNLAAPMLSHFKLIIKCWNAYRASLEEYSQIPSWLPYQQKAHNAIVEKKEKLCQLAENTRFTALLLPDTKAIFQNTNFSVSTRETAEGLKPKLYIFDATYTHVGECITEECIKMMNNIEDLEEEKRDSGADLEFQKSESKSSKLNKTVTERTRASQKLGKNDKDKGDDEKDDAKLGGVLHGMIVIMGLPKESDLLNPQGGIVGLLQPHLFALADPERPIVSVSLMFVRTSDLNCADKGRIGTLAEAAIVPLGPTQFAGYFKKQKEKLRKDRMTMIVQFEVNNKKIVIIAPHFDPKDKRNGAVVDFKHLAMIFLASDEAEFSIFKEKKFSSSIAKYFREAQYRRVITYLSLSAVDQTYNINLLNKVEEMTARVCPYIGLLKKEIQNGDFSLGLPNIERPNWGGDRSKGKGSVTEEKPSFFPSPEKSYFPPLNVLKQNDQLNISTKQDSARRTFNKNFQSPILAATGSITPLNRTNDQNADGEM